MITVARTSSGQFSISDGQETIVLSRTDYEDVFFACPLDPSALYLLLNQTILQTAEQRDVLKRIVARCGGIIPTMEAIQAGVLALDPKEAAEPAATMKRASEAQRGRVISPQSAPPTSMKEVIPVAEVVASPVKVIEPELVSTAPASPQAPPQATKLAEEKGSVSPPDARTKNVAVSRTGDSGSSLVPAAQTPPTTTPKTTILHKKQAAQTTPPLVDKPKNIIISRAPDGSYTLRFGSQSVTLSNEKFRELYFSLPMSIPSMFKLFFTSLLPDIKSKTIFRRMMSMAGGSSVLLEKIVKELEKLRAQDV